MSREQITEILIEAAMLISDYTFAGGAWLTPMCDRLWDYDSHSWAEEYGELVRLLYDVGFLGCALGPGEPIAYKYGNSDLLLQDSAVNAISVFTVHPAFRPALDIDHQ